MFSPYYTVVRNKYIAILGHVWRVGTHAIRGASDVRLACVWCGARLGNCISSNSQPPATYACASESFNVTTCMTACEMDEGCTAYQSSTYA